MHLSVRVPASDAVENSAQGVTEGVTGVPGEMCQEELFKKIMPVLSEMKVALSRSRQQPNEKPVSRYLLRFIIL